MNFLDIRTVIFSELVSDAVCFAVLGFLWVQNRRRFAGTFYWVADFGLQTAGVLLIILRGKIPDWLSIGFTNPAIVTGAFLGYLGLEQFVGKKSSQIHNYLIIAVLVLVNSYFTYLQPSLEARNVVLALMLLVICFQCAWLMLYRTGSVGRRTTFAVGVVFGLYCLVSLVWIAATLVAPPPTNDFFHSDLFDTLVLMVYQILLILLTFSLVLLVNRNLIFEAQTQEEKYGKAFHSSPYAMTLTQASDGRILEVNDGFLKMTGYTCAEVAGRTTLELRLWSNEADRAKVVEELSKGMPVREREFEFRRKSGEKITGLFSAEWITISGQPWILSSISDISARKRAEQELQDHEARLHLALEAAQGGIWEWDLQTNENFWSDELWKVYGLEPRSCTPSYEAWTETIHPDDRAGAEQAVQAAARTGSELNAEWRVHDPRGSQRWLMSRGQPVRDAGGKVVRYIGAVLDITARKQAEEQIALLAKFPFENPNPILRINHDGTILYANPASQALLGDWGTQVGESAPRAWCELVAQVLQARTGQTIETKCADRIYSLFIVPLIESRYVNLYGRDITEQKQAEEAVITSERRYRHTLDAMLEGCQILGFDWRYLYLNTTAERHNRRPNEELLGQKYMDMWPGITSTEAFAVIQKCMDERLPKSMENEFTFPDGAKGWFDLSIYPVPEGIVILSIDITERKRIQEALRESEEKFRAMIEQATEGFILLDESGKIIEWNHAEENIWGLKREEVVGRPFWEVQFQGMKPERRTPERYEYLKTTLLDALATGQSPIFTHTLEAVLYCANAELKNIEQAVFPIKTEDGFRIGSMTRDVTQRKQAEEAIRASESRYRELVQNANSAIIRWGRDGTVLFFNEFAQRLFGYTSEEIVGKNVNILLPVTESAGSDPMNLVDEVVAHPDQFVNNVNENVCRDGRRLWMAWTNKPVLDENGCVSAILAVGIDITEQKRAEEALERERAELARFNAELEQFAYVASHDLQEPLRMVASYMQLLEQRYKGKLDRDADDFIGFAVDGAGRMQRLINDLLTYSRLGTRGSPFESISSQEILDQALENLQIAIHESKARVTHDPLPEVVADGSQLVQLFQNLVGNAIKFHGKKAPRVHVSAALLPRPPSARKEETRGRKKEWVFSITDNGIGIDPQYADRIFVVFQRLHSREKYEGTGIGLAICKKIVQRHGGRIWVESQPGKGATFYFTLPMKDMDEDDQQIKQAH